MTLQRNEKNYVDSNLIDEMIIKINLYAKNLINFLYFLFWLLIDPSKFQKIKTQKIKNLLIIHGGAIGDAYVTIGIMNRLNEKYPKVNLYYLTIKKNRNFVKSPFINIVDIKAAKNLIFNKKIEAVILFYGATRDSELFDSEIYLNILKIPYRVSCDFFKLNTQTIFKQIIPPLVTRKIFNINSNNFKDQLKAFKALGFEIDTPKFYYTKEGEEAAKKIIKNHKITRKEKLIFLHPGGGTIIKAIKEGKIPSHMWFPERWAKVADTLIEKSKARIIFTGMGKEIKIINKIISKIKNKERVVNLTDKTKSLEEVASLFKRGDLLISIDTGVAHIAAQTDISLIVLFSTVSPKEVSPIAKKKIDIFHPEACHLCRRYACPTCHYKCMGAITAEEVVDAANKLLS